MRGLRETGVRTEVRGKPSSQPLPLLSTQYSVLSLRGGGSNAAGNPPAYSLRAPRLSKGFTLIELTIVITIVVILAVVLLDRVWFYQEQAEKTAMVEVAGAIQSALTMQHGRLLMRGIESEVTSLASDNPMKWLSKQPRNYSGEFYDPTPRSVAPGNWVFDLRSRELIYVLDRADHFIPGKDGQKWIRYRVNLMYDPALDTSGKTSKKLEGVLFEPTVPYRWF